MEAERSQRYDCLDVWRGVACLLVVVGHIGTFLPRVDHHWTEPFIGAMFGFKRMPWGLLGVLMFFVVSGYCIAATSDHFRGSQHPGRVFLWRRFRRIYPTCWAATGCLALLMVLGPYCPIAPLTPETLSMHGPAELSPLEWLGNLTMTESWRFHVTGGEPRYLNGIIWTLCYEEQFYLMCFLILMFVPRAIFRTLAVVTAVAAVIWMIAACTHPASLCGTFLDQGWLFFACGVGVYYCLHHAREGRRRRIAIGVTAILAAMAASLHAVGLLEGSAHFASLSLPVCMGFAVVLIGLHRYDQAMLRHRLIRSLGFVGQISYSLYLVHIPVAKSISVIAPRVGLWSPERGLLITAPVCVAGSIIAAFVFFQLIERRFLNPSSIRVKSRSEKQMSVSSAAVPGCSPLPA